jgi:hypothetical protein
MSTTVANKRISALFERRAFHLLSDLSDSAVHRRGVPSRAAKPYQVLQACNLWIHQRECVLSCVKAVLFDEVLHVPLLLRAKSLNSLHSEDIHPGRALELLAQRPRTPGPR